MSILRHIFAVTLFAVGVATACPQSITESVTVEGKYTPDVFPADRLALLPAAITLKAPDSKMAYDRKGLAANFAPDALNLPPTGWLADKTYDTSKGYAGFRLGSWLNSSLSAGYNAVNTQDTRLNVYLQHNSTSLWQAWKGEEETGLPAADRRFRYDETIGLDLQHKLAEAGVLSAGLQYHLGYFNYYGTVQGPQEVDGHVKAPTQTLNDIFARVGWIGKGSESLKYTADADIRYFAYRAMYVPLITDQYPRQFAKTKGEREAAVNVGGNVSYGLNDASGNGSSIGAALRYSGVINAIGNDVNRVELIPAYTLIGRGYALRLGANLAVVGNGASTRFRIAPDVSFTSRKGILAFSAAVGGGTHLRTLAWMRTMDYYSNPGYGCYEAAYSPIDARVAFQLNPGGKWTFGLAGEWRTTIGESFATLYQPLLNDNLSLYGSYDDSGKIHGFTIEVNAGYEFCRYLAISGKAAWQPQHGSTGFLNGFDRAALTGEIIANSRPTDRLSLNLDYSLRAKRMYSLKSFNAMNLSAEYKITDKISIGVELNNLLDRHQEILPGLPVEGFNAVGGLQVVF